MKMLSEIADGHLLRDDVVATLRQHDDPALRAFGQIAHFGRRYKRHYDEALARIARVERDRAAIEDNLERAGRAFFDERLPRSPFYAARLAESAAPADAPFAERVAALPLLTREHIASEVDALRVPPRLGEHTDRFRYTTAGTTGPPLSIFCDLYTYVYSQALTEVALRWAGRAFERVPLVSSQLLLSLFDNLPERHAAMHTHTGFSWLFSLRLGGPDSVREAVALKPDVLASDPQSLERLRALLAEHADLRQSWRAPRAVISSGLPLRAEDRGALAEALGAPLIDVYALTEAGPVAVECAAGAGLHIDESSLYVEIVDREGQPLPEGELGEIVVTSLRARYIPLVRYRTRDIGAITSEPCACGVRMRRLSRIAGRVRSFFVGADEGGALINPLPLGARFAAAGVDKFELRQRELHTFVLTTPRALEPAQHEAAREAVGELVGARVQLSLSVSDAPFAPHVKHCAFVSELHQQRASSSGEGTDK